MFDLPSIDRGALRYIRRVGEDDIYRVRRWKQQRAESLILIHQDECIYQCLIQCFRSGVGIANGLRQVKQHISLSQYASVCIDIDADQPNALLRLPVYEPDI